MQPAAMHQSASEDATTRAEGVELDEVLPPAWRSPRQTRRPMEEKTDGRWKIEEKIEEKTEENK